MIDILNDIKNARTRKEKISILQEHIDNGLLMLVLRMAYDRHHYVWPFKMNDIIKARSVMLPEMGLIKAIAWMSESLPNCNDNAFAAEAMHSILISVEGEERKILEGIIKGNLKLGISAAALKQLLSSHWA